MDLTEPAIDYAGLARSMGIRGEKPSSLKEAQKLIAECLADNKPALIDVTIDRSFKPL
jgi:benzoylformate decarboxylase